MTTGIIIAIIALMVCALGIGLGLASNESNYTEIKNDFGLIGEEW